jgi:hypothetical protein
VGGTLKKHNKMKNKNPFIPGDRVVCIDDDWNGVKFPDNDPKKGDVLIVAGVKDEWINFKEHS